MIIPTQDGPVDDGVLSVLLRRVEEALWNMW